MWIMTEWMDAPVSSDQSSMTQVVEERCDIARDHGSVGSSMESDELVHDRFDGT
jgi:hypothetical protein